MAAVLAGDFYANESGRRLLLWALAGSLTLHLALLFVLPFLQDANRVRAVAPALTAHLAKLKPAEPAQPRIEPVAPRPPASAPVSNSKAVPRSAVPPSTSPEPTLIVEPGKQVAETALAVPATPAAAPSDARQAPTVRVEPQPAIQAAGGPDPGSVARFRLELMDLARRFKKYPRIAQDNGWEGRVELRIAIGEDGAISSLSVKKGAGRTVLDDEAQAMIRSAKAKATIPPGLRGKAFNLEISVDFFLKD